ncbi:DOG1-like protein 4, partial [Tanacetum coccineum]
FLVCSPPWFTSFEQTLFWVTEFPPSFVFRFIKDLNLTPDQEIKVESFKVDTARKEAEIGEAMAMVQESLAAAPLYGLVNRAERLVDGEVSQLDDAMEEVKEAMRAVVAEADGLRVKVVKQVLEVLDVVQRVKLFAAVGQFRIRIRQVGLQMTPTQTL